MRSGQFIYELMRTLKAGDHHDKQLVSICTSVFPEMTYIHTLLYLPSNFRVTSAANISEHLTIR